jgi:predicted DCC family thiol-disulfide oxidoreductase YuxK
VEVLSPVAIVSLAAELLIALALWLPRTRHMAFVVGLGLHLSIILTMAQPGHLILFAALMFALYLLFLDAAPSSRLVLWDDRCSFCRVWVCWFRRLDWLGVHRFVGSSDPGVLASAAISREEADTAIQLVVPSGTRVSGFRAVRTILERLPVSFLWAPLLRIPHLECLGERAYAAVAARRSCTAELAVELATVGVHDAPDRTS